jgi:hypothetical protein
MLASVASFVSILNGQRRHEKVTALMVKCFELGRQVRCPHLLYTSRSLEVLYELRSEHKLYRYRKTICVADRTFIYVQSVLWVRQICRWSHQ